MVPVLPSPLRCLQQAFGGSVVFCSPEEDVAVAVLVNSLTLDRVVTKRVCRMVCTGLRLGRPAMLDGGMF